MSTTGLLRANIHLYSPEWYKKTTKQKHTEKENATRNCIRQYIYVHLYYSLFLVAQINDKVLYGIAICDMELQNEAPNNIIRPASWKINDNFHC